LPRCPNKEVQPLVQLATGLGAASVAGFAALPPPGARLRRSNLRQVAAGRDRAGGSVARILPRGLALRRCRGRCLPDRLWLTSAVRWIPSSKQLQRRISQRRASLRLDPNAGGGSALNLLAKRKQTTPSSVMVLEALSQALPDSTYVTDYGSKATRFRSLA